MRDRFIEIMMSKEMLVKHFTKQAIIELVDELIKELKDEERDREDSPQFTIPR